VKSVRIGYFVNEYPPNIVGGLGEHAKNLGRELTRLGHDISLFTVNNGSQDTRKISGGIDVNRVLVLDSNDIIPSVVSDDLRRWGTGIRDFSEIFLYNILSAHKFVNVLIKNEGYKFDIIYVHDWLSAPAGIIAKRNTDLPLVFHVHSTEWGRKGGYGSKTISDFERKAAETADLTITVSNAMYEDLMGHGFPSEKIRVVWNGISTDRYNPEKLKDEEIQSLRNRYGIEPEDKMILFVGRLVPVKGVWNLLQAMTIVAKKHPEAKLVILGRGDPGEERRITDMVRAWNLENNVKTRFEFVSEPERILHYAACDMAVFPSLYEPFGIVCLEAMAMAKPVVAGARGVSGFREQVIPSGEEQTGLHVNGEDPTDIGEWGIIPLLDDPEGAKEMGKRGRERAKEYFSWEKAAKSTLEIFDETIRQNK